MRYLQREKSTWRGPIIFGLILMAAIAVICVAAYAVLSFSRGENSTRILQVAREEFPEIDTSELSPLRSRVVEILHQQFDDPQPGTFYSQGEKQDWCANFVSWVNYQAGVPLENPHSGGWRIPGVYSLETAYRNAGKFRTEGYQPKPGDTILYDTASRHGQHVNFVLKYENGEVTTIGGNENNAIHIQKFNLAEDGPIRGFGVLE